MHLNVSIGVLVCGRSYVVINPSTQALALRPKLREQNPLGKRDQENEKLFLCPCWRGEGAGVGAVSGLAFLVPWRMSKTCLLRCLHLLSFCYCCCCAKHLPTSQTLRFLCISPHFLASENSSIFLTQLTCYLGPRAFFGRYYIILRMIQYDNIYQVNDWGVWKSRSGGKV